MLLEGPDNPFEHVRWIPAVVVCPSDDVRRAVTKAHIACTTRALFGMEVQQHKAIGVGIDDWSEPVVGVLVDDDDPRPLMPGLGFDALEKPSELDGPPDRGN